MAPGRGVSIARQIAWTSVAPPLTRPHIRSMASYAIPSKSLLPINKNGITRRISHLRPNSSVAMSTNPLSLAQVLNKPLLTGLYDFWFQHTESDESLTLPTPSELKHWFFKSDVFDRACTTQYGSALAAIKSANPSPEEILSIVKPTSPRDWLALLLLLDQLPRNCYRGAASRIVFEFFDPLALTIALEAEQAGIPRAPEIKHRLGLRMWFYLPLIHSEELSIQELARQRYAEMAEDFDRVFKGKIDGDGAQRDNVQILLRNRDRAQEQIDTSVRFQREHLDPIARFGRFPHRNEAMGRQSTDEERKYVENGGTFGQ